MPRELARWNPLREMESLRERMDDLLMPYATRTARWPGAEAWSPPVDVEETENELVVRAELPGMKKDDIDVSVQGDTLSIRGERKFDGEEKRQNYHRVERCYGAFQRYLVLPSEVDPAKAKAKYHDGVLELKMPKSERARPKKVAIEV